MEESPESALRRLQARRAFIRNAATGTTVVTLGAVYALSDSLTRQARAESRRDGRPRLPPGQRVLERLKPMGGRPGEPKLSAYRLRVHGEVRKPFELDFAQLLAMPQHEGPADVHCVTGWSLLGASWKGVRLVDLAEKAGVKDSARHVIFEAAHGYTANVSRKDAFKPEVMIAHQHQGRPLARTHGAPVRSLVPDLYFWKSAKWLTGIRFVTRDQPGYWETRGYHNHADPWREERHSA